MKKEKEQFDIECQKRECQKGIRCNICDRVLCHKGTLIERTHQCEIDEHYSYCGTEIHTCVPCYLKRR